ncbi:lymphocyte antigen 75-like [Oreochromis aureus]|uniref:lymphocyte antigen 75-like n=1 Tax=Oreochromis aureus TaxID=47969 RepID=UPI001954AE01|nr:lymphocyte antigen 75-like [Oreochromis aureus]
MKWIQAQNYCRKTYTNLATVHNAQDFAELSEVIGSSGYLWFGLQPDTEAWEWSLENQDHYDEGEADFRMWNNGEPSYGISSYMACVAMLQNGNWDDQLCENLLPFYCYNKKTSSFTFVGVSKSWGDAQSHCRDHYTDLASVRNQSESQQLKAIATSTTWIGLYRNSWKWSDGSTFSFTNWFSNSPSTVVTSSCGASSSVNWVNSNCIYTRKFVCFTAVSMRKVLKVQLKTTNTAVDMEGLKENILEKFSQRLNEHSPNEEFKLRWLKEPDGKTFNKDDEKELDKSSGQDQQPTVCNQV